MSEHYEKGRKAAGEGWADVKTAAYQNGYGCVGADRIAFIKGYLSASGAAQ